MGWYCPRCGHEAETDGTCPRDAAPLARVSSHDLLGRKLGEYTVLQQLGGGSYGSVYRAVHERSGLLVAIKLLHQPIDSTESQRVLVEARAAAMLSHPNVVQVYDLALATDRRPYIVMQLLDGQPLARLLTQPLPIALAVSIANDVLSALAVAHVRGVIHRDLKPDNIFVTKGRAIIVDFGLAKLVADPRAPSLTMTGEALGTPHYMAPEQVRGEPADGRADLYAVGCVLFEALVGHPPFQGGATFAVFDAQLNRPAPSARELRPDVPAAIDAAIQTALAKHPNARFADAAEMQRALAGTSTRRRRRWPFAVAGVLALGGIATAAVWSASSAGSAEPPDRGSEPVDRTGSDRGVRADHSGPDRTDRIPVRTNRSPDPPVRTGPRQVVVPPALPGEPAIEPQLETSLIAMAAAFNRGNFSRADAVRMRCAMTEVYAHPPAGMPAAMRAFTRRYVKLLDDAHPGIDPAVECNKPAPPVAATPKKHPTPPPLADELPRIDSIETSLVSIHDALDAGYLGSAAAHTMSCELASQDAQEIARNGTVMRQLRGLHRRINLLLEVYLPGSTSGTCP